MPVERWATSCRAFSCRQRRDVAPMKGPNRRIFRRTPPPGTPIGRAIDPVRHSTRHRERLSIVVAVAAIRGGRATIDVEFVERIIPPRVSRLSAPRPSERALNRDGRYDALIAFERPFILFADGVGSFTAIARRQELRSV
jgi:hypothetical protein